MIKGIDLNNPIENPLINFFSEKKYPPFNPPPLDSRANPPLGEVKDGGGRVNSRSYTTPLNRLASFPDY